MAKITEKKRNIIKALKITNKEISCSYCSKKLADGTNIKNGATMDHIIPKQNGGPDTYSNLLLCCEECNQLKSNYSFDEFCSLMKKDKKDVLLRIITSQEIIQLNSHPEWKEISYKIE